MAFLLLLLFFTKVEYLNTSATTAYEFSYKEN